MESGSKIGPYTTTRELGRGGMGVVYLSRDTRLDRDVAIKALPEHLASDPDRLARFEREAKTLAQLNHPNVAGIYGIEEHEGARYLVLEYVEGETLADRIAKGPIPVRDVLEQGIGIAQALEAAHDKGIIHRDLKPANVKVTPDGTVKVLDFGLAKAMSGDASTTDVANSPTITMEHTRPGVVLGTAAYMSPEQARGRALDKRTDIWSFGALLYECLTGTRPFLGETTSDLVAKILERDPDWSTLPPDTPPLVQLLLRRCLAKDRNKRLRDIGDAQVEIELALHDPTTSGLLLASAAIRAESARPRRRAWSWLAFLAVGLLVGWAGSTLMPRTPTTTTRDVGVVRFGVPLPPKTQIAGWASPVVAISPDGKKIAFVAMNEGVQRLFIRHLDDERTILVPGEEPVEGPFFSPDSRWVGYADGGISGRSSAPGRLRKVSVDGSVDQTLCEIGDYFGAIWTKDGTIYYSGLQFRLRRVPDTGGSASLVFPESWDQMQWPQLLPGGKTALIVRPKVRRAEILDLSTGKTRGLGLETGYALYAPNGRILYSTPDRSIQAVPFDVGTGSIRGTGLTVLSDVAVSCNEASAAALSNNGDLVYVSGYLRDSEHEPFKIARVGRDGAVQDVVVEEGVLGDGFALSPDGKRFVLARDNALWIHDLERKTRLKLPTGEAGSPKKPIWSLDGECIVFTAAEGDNLYRQDADGGREPELLLDRPGEQHAFSWSADGRTLVFASTWGPDNGIYLLEPGEPDARCLLPASSYVTAPVVSPDGRLIAYQTGSSGRAEVVLQRFPELGPKLPVSVDGGKDPVWSRDGHELYYRNGSRIMTVLVETEPSLRLSTPAVLFESADVKGFRSDPGGDGLVVRLREPTSGIQTELHVVLNWLDEVEAKAMGRSGR